MPELGEYIRKKRLDAEMTQQELVDEMSRVAERAGFPCNADGPMVSRWEKGHRTPSPVHRKFLSRALDFPYTELEELV